LYENPINPIDVSSLVKELTNLNKIIAKFNIDEVSKKLEYVSTLQDSLKEGGFLGNQIKYKKINKTKTHNKKNNKKDKTRKRRLY